MHLLKAPLFCFFSVLFLLFQGALYAQKDTTTTVPHKKDSLDYYDMNLEQLMKVKGHDLPSELEALVNSLISVASKKPLSTRESPSILTLVTEEDIKASGARDLTDVLRLVPGIDFGVDVQGVVGIGMRGNWAHEGKVLMLLDGQEMNEGLYATTQLGNHFPIDQIKKIEIIRGPGSAIYGGYAEYGVINIITRQGGDINGVSVSGLYGQTAKDYMRRDISLAAGTKKGDLEWSLSGMAGQGQRSDQVYTDVHGHSFNMPGNSELDPLYANLGFKYKGFSARGIVDYFHTTIRDGYDRVMPGAVTEDFNSVYLEAKYIWRVSEKLSITPKFNFKNQTPWKTPVGDSLDAPFIRAINRTTANITASYNPTRYINILGGTEYYQDHAFDKLPADTFYNGKRELSFYNYSFFVQGLLKTRYVNLIIGARYDKHNIYGDAFVPRVGLTKKYNRFHFKALYSNSFRAPALENIDFSVNQKIYPEKTQVAELELGYQLTHKSIFTINFFDIRTDNAIIYYSVGQRDAYTNEGQTGTRGLEAEYKIKAKWGYIAANYSFYTALGMAKAPAYRVATDSAMLLGFASHKVNLTALCHLTKNLSLNLTASWYSQRWGYNSVTVADTVSQLKKFDPVLLMNVYLRYHTPVKGLTAGIGIYDFLDQRFVYIQPYAESTSKVNLPHAPLPAPGREFVLRISWDIPFKTTPAQ
ncbi:MAG: TonB-dependent receptor plug domain-containing protein [Bacteroidia bacterium]